MRADPGSVVAASGGRATGLIVGRRYYAEVTLIAAVVGAATALRSGPVSGAVAAAVAVAVLVVSVGLHEGAHAAVAAAVGIRVHALRLRGALTASIVRGTVPTGPRGARQDLLICLAGPVASLALLLAAIAVLAGGATGPVQLAGWCLFGANLIAALGSLPGLPGTDGTRAVQAWRDRSTVPLSSPAAQRAVADR